MNWYITVGQETQGPLTEEQIQNQIKSGTVTKETLVWQEGMAEWAVAGTVAALTPLFHKPAPPKPPAPVAPPKPAPPKPAPPVKPAPPKPPAPVKPAAAIAPVKPDAPKPPAPSTPAKPAESSMLKIPDPVVPAAPAPKITGPVQPILDYQNLLAPESDNAISNFAKWAEGVPDDPSLCPTCGYFVGSLLTCPRCGARPGKRLSIRLVKMISVIGSIVGIILLWMAAYAKQPMVIKIGDVTEVMNGALVKVVGVVSSYEENAENDSLRMKVDDGSGEITVSAYNKLKQLKKVLGKNMPTVGDRVEVTGSINETQKFGISMFLSIPERLKLLERFKMVDSTISKISLDDVGKIFRIKATIAAISKRTNKKGTVIHSYTITDGARKIEMSIFGFEMDGLADDVKNLLVKGNTLQMIVKIGEFRGKLQADIIDFNKIKKLGAADAAEMAPGPAGMESEDAEAPTAGDEEKSGDGPKSIDFGELQTSDEGKQIQVSAEVKNVEVTPKGARRMTLDDGTGSMNIMLWEDFKQQIPDYGKIKAGAMIEGPFEVEVYKGKVQLKISDPAAITVE